MNITVYLGSSFGNRPEFREAAEEIGTWIGKSGHRLIYGGSAVGLMGVLADSALAAGAEVIGVEPQFFLDEGLEHTGITKTIPTETMAERKVMMMELGDAFVALSGGAGTLDEISEVIVLAALNKHDKPCVLYDKNGFYEPLRAVYDRMVEAGLMSPDARKKVIFADTVEAVGRAVTRENV